MTDHPKLRLGDLPLCITNQRPPADMTDAEITDSAGAFSLLLELATNAQEQLTTRRYTLVAEHDQLAARQRDLETAAHPGHPSDKRTIAAELAALHGDLQAHLHRWEQLESQQHDITSVVVAAGDRWRALLEERTRRHGRSQ